MTPSKIALIRPGHSPANKRFISVLQEAFPAFQVEVIDVLGKKEMLGVANIVAALLQGRPGGLRNKEALRNRLAQTTYLFHKIKHTIARRLNKDEYLFSFQIQSMFDGSVAGLPHFVYTDHTELTNLEYPDFAPTDIDPRWIALEKTIYHHARMNFVRSTNVHRTLINEYACAPEKVALVYAGSNVGIHPHKQVNTARYHSKHILFVGVDWQRKGGPELVEAFKQVLQVHPDARLTIVGSTPDIDLPNCNVVGKVPLSALQHYYEQAAVFCLPTRREPFGIVFIEALSYKLPIVATSLGAIPDFVLHGESGYRVDATNNVDQLAAALIDLIGNPAKCQAFGERGHQIAMERYTWQQTGARIRQHIEGVLGEPAVYAHATHARNERVL